MCAGKRKVMKDGIVRDEVREGPKIESKGIRIENKQKRYQGMGGKWRGFQREE